MNGRVASVMSSDMGVMEWIACGFGVNCESMGVVLALPVLNEGMDGVDQAVLWN